MELIFNLTKKILLFVFILFCVLWANHAVITFNLMYPEQPSIYLVNQTIHHVSDLLNIYLHPTLLNQNIPFFRPSGHFLLYQLITPFLGWHNTKAFFVLNFIFLALIGYLFIDLYQRLFPGNRLGGYIGFSLYLMHPALSLARITLMHFEFAYVFFLFLALDIFIICYQSARTQTLLKNSSLFALSLFVYMVAVTFKEPAIMLGPILVSYICIFSYQQESVVSYLYELVSVKKTRWMIISITLISFLLSLYLIASWPNTHYPLSIFSLDRTLGAINSFFIDVWGARVNLFDRGYLVFGDLAWRTIIFPDVVRYMIWLFCVSVCISFIFLFFTQNSYRKAVIFLLVASVLFLVLPFAWATGGPWHYTLTLITINLLMGFSFDFNCKVLRINPLVYQGLGLMICLCNFVLTFYVNQLNIQKYDQVENGKLGLAVNRNAVLHPPAIQKLLTPSSVIVVEDSQLHNDYLMGNAAYPYLLFLGLKDFDVVEQKQSAFFLKFQPLYSGTFFRYAYLRPSLKEQLYPFTVENMNMVPNEIIYSWLSHHPDIFCFGYDAQGNWHDKTTRFKYFLHREQQLRGLILKKYIASSIQFENKSNAEVQNLPYPDVQLCQYRCDQDKDCLGFTYQFFKIQQRNTMKCFYSNTKYSISDKRCRNCVWYQKQ